MPSPSLRADATGTLSWIDNSGDETAFIVQRKDGPCSASGAFVEIARTGANVTSYLDSTVVAGRTYCYRVAAYKTGAAPSAYTNTAERIVPDGTPVPPIVTTAPIAAYAFDEGTGTTSADASGGNHPLTLVGSPAWVPGKYGSALSFNGTSSYATSPLTTQLAAWTISGWVSSPAAPANAPVSGPLVRNANYQMVWNHPSASFRGSAALSVGGVWYAASFGPLLANTWYYLAASYDGETLNAYTNGALVTSNATPSGAPNLETSPLTIGRHSTLTQYFRGLVDNVRIYDRALSLAEIQADMTTPVASVTAPPPPPPSAVPVSLVAFTATPPDTTGGWSMTLMEGTGVLGATVPASPYELTVPLPSGSHAVTAVWTRSGSSITSEPVTVVCP